MRDTVLRGRREADRPADIRNCTTKEEEKKRVNAELANIRTKFRQSDKLSPYDRKK